MRNVANFFWTCGKKSVSPDGVAVKEWKGYIGPRNFNVVRRRLWPLTFSKMSCGLPTSCVSVETGESPVFGTCHGHLRQKISFTKLGFKKVPPNSCQHTCH